MRMRLTSLALLLLSAPLAAQAGEGMGMGKSDKMTMKNHAMPAVPFAAMAPHTAAGSYQVVVENDKHSIKLSDDFSVGGAPDAFVYLAKDGKVDASALELGQLTSMSGSSSFTIPDEKKAMEYNTVVIWSKAHGAAIATAPLHQMMRHDRMMKHDSGMMSHDTGMKHQ